MFKDEGHCAFMYATQSDDWVIKTTILQQQMCEVIQH